jgi:hypothetical protein
MSKPELVPAAYNMVLDLHLELLQQLRATHAPRKLANRLETATTSAAISVGVATDLEFPYHVKHARERLEVAATLLEPLYLEHFLNPFLYQWAKQQIERILKELDSVDWKKKLVPLRPPIQNPPPTLRN